MLGMCKAEVARGEAGFCTGYVIATFGRLAADGQVCHPPLGQVEYEDMLLAVIGQIEKFPQIKSTLHAVDGALTGKWPGPCKATR
jgi:hypothetical protein